MSNTTTTNFKEYTDEYGFKCLDVTTKEGGRITLTDFKKGADDQFHLYKSDMNPHGLGGSKHIYNNEDIDKAIKDINETVWFNTEEEALCIEFLESRKIV